jgi:cytochrome c oxidase accessory protein FixG
MDVETNPRRGIVPSGERSQEFVDARAVNSKEARDLYKKREQIYPKLVQGPWRRLKWAAMIVLLTIYYVTPWIRWDRGPGQPNQAVLVDFEGPRFYFGPIELWPQEVIYITGLLMLASFGLFLATALFGRVWCGYACPQTVWTDLYLHVERWIEGDRSARIRLDKAPLSFSKVAKKVIKHALWLVIALATGGAWVFYFADAPTLLGEIFTGRADLSVYLFIGILTFTTYTLAGTMREQVCTYMCPWPRIQAALTDPDAIQVTYRVDRGEPRGPHKKGTSWDGRGDCIDCNQCVAACPMGIDIREGSQLECINCALCIDACDDVMRKVDRPTGLIAYDNDANMARRKAGEEPRFVWLRPRTVLYASLFVSIAAVMLYSLTTRAGADLNVLRDRSPAFVQLSDGSVRNGYEIKLVNKAGEARVFTLSVAGLVGGAMASMGLTPASDGTFEITADADAVTTLRVTLTAPPSDSRPDSVDVVFTATALDGEDVQSAETVFISGTDQ